MKWFLDPNCNLHQCQLYSTRSLWETAGRPGAGTDIEMFLSLSPSFFSFFLRPESFIMSEAAVRVVAVAEVAAVACVTPNT